MAAYVDHVGFTLISLFEGFVIVLTLDLGGPGWVVALVAIAGILAGRSLIRRVQMGLPAS